MKARAGLEDTVKDYSALRETRGAVGLEVSLRDMVARWPDALRAEFEERAAIIEFDGGEPRAAAERRAYRLIRDAQQVETLLKEWKE